jgi:hypothetical protein
LLGLFGLVAGCWESLGDRGNAGERERGGAGHPGGRAAVERA